MDERVCLPTRAADLAEAIYVRGGYEEAEEWTRTAQAYAATDDICTQLLWRSVRAKIFARRGSLQEAEALAREAVALGEQTDELNRRARVLLDLGEVLQLGGKPVEAGAAIELGLELFERKGNRIGAEHARQLLRDVAPGKGKAPV